MQVMLMRLMSKGEYLIVPKGTKFTGSGKLGFKVFCLFLHEDTNKTKGICKNFRNVTIVSHDTISRSLMMIIITKIII